MHARHLSTFPVNWHGPVLHSDHHLSSFLVSLQRSRPGLGWQGWLVIERSRDAADARNVVGNFGANARTLKRVFQAE